MSPELLLPVTVDGEKRILAYIFNVDAVVTAYFKDDQLNERFGTITFQVFNVKQEPSIESRAISITPINCDSRYALAAWKRLKLYLSEFDSPGE